jgi:CDP-diacylglycerol--glycerol-3-phosphate 3-phosphatidyltransferase
MNLPNSLTVARIVASPAVALLPFAPSWGLRFAGFWLFIAVAVTDYYDGHLARSRDLVTDLGRLLDPLADKLLLLATFIPMFLLVGSGWDAGFLSPHRTPLVEGVLGPMLRQGTERGVAFPFVTPWGPVGLPWWVLAVVLGRELFMTLFRQAAARRGVIIAAIGPAKWKTGFQWTWVGAAYFWFFAATLAARRQWDGLTGWNAFANFNGLVGVVAMIGAVALTIYSLALYLRSYGRVFTDAPVRGRS